MKGREHPPSSTQYETYQSDRRSEEDDAFVTYSTKEDEQDTDAEQSPEHGMDDIDVSALRGNPPVGPSGRNDDQAGNTERELETDADKHGDPDAATYGGGPSAHAGMRLGRRTAVRLRSVRLSRVPNGADRPDITMKKSRRRLTALDRHRHDR